MYTRRLQLHANPQRSFFLWGPRQTGKTTLLKSAYPEAFRIDLLRTDELMRYLQQPSLLREQVAAVPPEKLIVIDEIQKAPVLLDEIHYMIQEYGRIFALCGSSARKLRRGQINLLGGRAMRYELLGLTAEELADEFSLTRMLNAGPLPDHYTADNPKPLLRAYIQDYLREEILEEGLIRSLPVFSDFLRVAAIGDTEILNMTNVARESGMAASTVRGHYGILEDTLMGPSCPPLPCAPRGGRYRRRSSIFVMWAWSIIWLAGVSLNRVRSYSVRPLRTGCFMNFPPTQDTLNCTTTFPSGACQAVSRSILSLGRVSWPLSPRGKHASPRMIWTACATYAASIRKLPTAS